MFADCTIPQELASVVQRTEETIGPIHFVNYNIGAQVGDRPLEDTSYRIFDVALRLGAVGAFAAAKEAANAGKVGNASNVGNAGNAGNVGKVCNAGNADHVGKAVCADAMRKKLKSKMKRSNLRVEWVDTETVL